MYTQTLCLCVWVCVWIEVFVYIYICIYIYLYILYFIRFLLIIIIIIHIYECVSPMVRETWVQPQVVSYRRLEKWYSMPPCLTLSNIRYVSRVKLCNPEKGVASSPTPQSSSYWKGSLQVSLDYGRQLYYYIILYLILYNITHIHTHTHTYIYIYNHNPTEVDMP